MKWTAMILGVLYGAAMCGQWTDDFSDEDLSSGVLWSGNAENFTAASGSLELDDTDPLLDQSLLSASVPMVLGESEWRFFIDLGFPGSSDNNARVYITADGNLQNFTTSGSAGVNGYFLKFGEAGSTDVIRLYRDNAGDITELGSGITSIAASFSCRIKVTRSMVGEWSVYADFNGGENFSLECTATDNAITAGNTVGVGCTYTSSNFNNFLFDDFYAGNPILDLMPPHLLEVTTSSATEADILFSESLNAMDSETLTNYSISGINIASVQQDVINPALVHLTFQTPLAANQSYQLTVSGLSDLSGNVMTTESVEFIYVVIVPPDFRSVRINEILADPNPVVGMPDAEFVELFNASDSVFYNLQDWIFVNTTSAKILPSFVLGPGEYVVLCDANNVALFSNVGNVIGIPSFTALTNTGDSLTLLFSDSTLVDMVSYTDDWFTTSLAAGGGVSLELVNPYSTCVGALGWIQSESAAGGTPGTVNSVLNTAPDMDSPQLISASISSSGNEATIIFSEPIDTSLSQNNPFIPTGNFVSGIEWNVAFTSAVITLFQAVSAPASVQIFIQGLADCSGNTIADTSVTIQLGLIPGAGDIVINEILADPSPVVGLPNAEFIELRNNTSTPLDLTTLAVNGYPIMGTQIIAANGFVVITDDVNTSLFDGVPLAYISSLSLTNTSDEIILTDGNDDVLDKVMYSIDWYNDAVKDDGGWSLERISPNTSCSGRNDWGSSLNETGGTPGLENSIFSIVTPESPLVLSSGVADSSSIYIVFNQSMDTTSGWQPPFTLPAGYTIVSKHWTTDLDRVNLRFADEFIPNTPLSLSVNAYMNCYGMLVDSSLLYFTVGFDPQPGDVIINEIMSDANGTNQTALPTADFIELYNRSGHLLELSELTINSDGFRDQVTLMPDSFLVIGDISDIAEFNGIQSFVAMDDFPSLYENGLLIKLEYRGNVIDAVEYNKSFYNDAAAESGGQSIERINPFDVCDAPDNWAACNYAAGSSAGMRNSVYNVSIDSISPVFQNIIYDNNNYLTLVFSEPISTDSVDIIATVNGVSISSALIGVAGLYGNELLIPLGNVSVGELFDVTISGVSDCWGNFSQNLRSTFSIPDTVYNAGDLIINEILYNPKDGGYDFVELYNPTDKSISLAGWGIADATNGEMNTVDLLTDRGFILLPDDYVVLTRNGSLLPSLYPATVSSRILRVDGLPDFSSDDEVYLLTPEEALCDYLNYDEDMHFDLLNSTDGVSLERISASIPTNQRENWNSASSSVNYATPGYLNSQQSEVRDAGAFGADPSIFSPDNDGYQDNLLFSYELEEVGFVGNLRIYNDKGQEVRHLIKSELLGREGKFIWNGLSELGAELPVGAYVAILEVFGLSGEVKNYRAVCVLAAKLN